MLRRKRWRFAMLAILPTLAIFAWVRIYPIVETLRLSVHKWDILSKNKPFIGLANFRELFGDRLFHRSAHQHRRSSPSASSLITIPLALVLAALIHHRARSRFAGFYETAIFIPHVVSLVPAAMAWKWIFDARLGPLNALLRLVRRRAQGMAVRPRPGGRLRHRALLLAGAGLCGADLSRRLQEPAGLALRGGEARRRHGPAVVLAASRVPMLKPITLYVSVVTLVSGFNVYAQAFVLASDAQGAPGRQVRVLVLDMLENSFRNYRVGYAASEAVVLLVDRARC